jgi:beta-lactamase regulating signal transducer with metallopeptidase domain
MKSLDVWSPSFSVSMTVALCQLFCLGVAVGAAALLGNRFLKHASAATRCLLDLVLLGVMLLGVPLIMIEQFALRDRPTSISQLDQQSSIENKDSRLNVSSRTAADDAAKQLGNPPSSGPSVSADLPDESEASNFRQGSVRDFAAPWIAGGYCFGVLAMFARFLSALYGGHRLRLAARAVDEPSILDLLKTQARAIGLRITPALAYCENMAVPVVIGIARPVILLPLSMVRALTPQQLRDVLTHELAHIRRLDHVVVLLQRLTEAMWFFHPAVWYVSWRLTREREHCCDDLVVTTGAQRISYADTLCRVAELTVVGEGKQAGPMMVAAVGRQPSHLRQRIVHLLEISPPPAIQLTRSGVFGLAALLAFVCLSHFLLPAISSPAQSPSNASPAKGAVGRSIAPDPADRKAETITVTVVCETPEGRPIAGADVTCFEIDTWTGRARAKATLKTDAAGKCRFEGIAVPLADVSRVLRGHSSVYCEVAAKAVGRASEVRTLNERGFPSLQHIQGSTGWMKLIMGPAQTLHGKVSNSKGEPIEGVLVYTARQAQSALPVDGFSSAKTDKNGEYKITDLKEWIRPENAGEMRIVSRQGNTVVGQTVSDHFTVRVWHPDYGQKWVPCRECPGELAIQMPDGGILAGRAIDATTKQTMPGVFVCAEAQPKRGASDSHTWYSSNWAITDRNGSYRLAVRAGNDYLVISNFEGFYAKDIPVIRALPANATATVDDIALVQAGIVRVHLIDAASKQRIRFSSKPQVSVVLHGGPPSVGDRDWPAEFLEGGTFLLRATLPDWTYSISVESNDPTISARPSVTALNVRPGEIVEIDLPVDVAKPGGANDKKR